MFATDQQMSNFEQTDVKKARCQANNVNNLPSCLPAFRVSKITVICAFLLFIGLPAFCAPISIKQTALKFLYAMGGVALSSFIIFAGLTIYNKLFVRKANINDDDDLSTPDNIDDAVAFFIKKNKLR